MGRADTRRGMRHSAPGTRLGMQFAKWQRTSLAAHCNLDPVEPEGVSVARRPRHLPPHQHRPKRASRGFIKA
jgi:hypothetical protein